MSLSLSSGAPLTTQVDSPKKSKLVPLFLPIRDFYDSYFGQIFIQLMTSMFGYIAGFISDSTNNHFLDDFQPLVVHVDTSYKIFFDQTKLLRYLVGQAPIPVIIDTRVSISLTSVITNFIGEIEPANLDTLQGLSFKTKVCGQGMVEWKIQVMF